MTSYNKYKRGVRTTMGTEQKRSNELFIFILSSYSFTLLCLLQKLLKNNCLDPDKYFLNQMLTLKKILKHYSCFLNHISMLCKHTSNFCN